MNKLTFIFISLIILLATSSFVAALGITPGMTTLEFSPGQEKTISFTIINSEHKDLRLQIYSQGELNQSVVLSTEQINMSSSQEEQTFQAILKLTGNLSPGKHTLGIVVMEQATPAARGAQASIGAQLAVMHQVVINVPYPGKYLEGNLQITGDNPKNFVISLNNLGRANINKVSSSILIYNSSGDNVKNLTTNEISLKSGEQNEITAQWNVDALDGNYLAKAVLDYDNQEVLLQANFDVGQFLLELQQLFVKDFTLGGIAKFNLVVQNRWSQTLNDVYAEMNVYNNNIEEIASEKSATYNIPSGLQTTINYYWDTANVSPGQYNASVILHYGDKNTQSNIGLNVGQNSIDVTGLGYVISSQGTGSGSNVNMTLVIIIGFLVLLNVAWFLIFRRKKKQ